MIVSGGIEAAVGHVHAAINDEQVRDIVHVAIAVHHGGFGIIAHAAGSRLVLSAAQALAGQFLPGLDGAGFLQPRLRFPRNVIRQ